MNMTDRDRSPAGEQNPGKWEVYFDGNFWGHPEGQSPGEEIPLDARFEWAGHLWVIPSVWTCGQGIVAEFCGRIDPEEIRAFAERWSLTPDRDSEDSFSREQRMRMDYENPLRLDFNPVLLLNGKPLNRVHGCSDCCNPVFPGGDGEDSPARGAVEHYGLDPSYGWIICRYSFPWVGRTRKVKTLSVTMEQRPKRLPGPHFRVGQPGDLVPFVHPVTGTEYTLTVKKITARTIPEGQFPGRGRMVNPDHMVTLRYTISPETDGEIEVRDCGEGDQPRPLSPDDPRHVASSRADEIMALIGGADGPVAMIVSEAPEPGQEPGVRSVSSSLYFDDVTERDIEWRVEFLVRQYENGVFPLLPGPR